MVSDRKSEHINLALKSQTRPDEQDLRFIYEPMLSAHPENADLSISFLGKTMRTPIWVSSMSPNYNLLWASPLNLFFAGLWAVKKWRLQTRKYFWLSGTLLLLSFVVGQHFNPAVYFIILILLVRVVVNLVPGKK